MTVKMILDFKTIPLGNLIRFRVKELNLDNRTVCSFVSCTEKELETVYESEHIDADILLRFCKLLDYDFFRLYTQHLILYAPSSETARRKTSKSTKVPVFRKNIYTREMIDFVLELLDTGRKSKIQITADYNIPKTTLHKWINKYSRR